MRGLLWDVGPAKHKDVDEGQAMNAVAGLVIRICRKNVLESA